MHAYRCTACTLMRCDANDALCDECRSRIADAKPTVKGKIDPDLIAKAFAKGTSFTLGSVMISPTPSIPVTPPPPTSAPIPSAAYKNVVKELKALPMEQGAEACYIWLYNAFPWSGTKKGATYWGDIYSELVRISKGGTP